VEVAVHLVNPWTCDYDLAFVIDGDGRIGSEMMIGSLD
jgi:hypothetical protein